MESTYTGQILGHINIGDRVTVKELLSILETVDESLICAIDEKHGDGYTKRLKSLTTVKYKEDGETWVELKFNGYTPGKNDMKINHTYKAYNYI